MSGSRAQVYKEIYEASLRECQGAGAPCMVESHRTMVHSIEHSPALNATVARLRQLDREMNPGRETDVTTQ